MLRTGLAVVLLVVVASTAGCADDSGASDGAAGMPTDASVADFCAAVKGSAGDDSDAQSVADKLAEVGTPKDIPAEARKGFEFLVDHAKELEKNDAAIQDEKAFANKYGADVVAEISALVAYAGTVCKS